MSLLQAKKRIEKLKEVINYHRFLYHVKNISEISEEALDSLKDELKKLEEKFPELVAPDSPTQRVAGKVLESFNKIKHKVEQWSFDDAFNLEDLKNWEKRNQNFLKKNSEGFEYFCELKIDGLKIILEYKDGILLNAATRGDGKIGEDVTENIKTIESVPLKLEKKVDGIFEGEVYISKKNFNKVNKQQKRKKKSLYANPRNLAAGTLRQLDTKIVSQRNLDVFIYDIAQIDGHNFKTQQEEMDFMSKLGFVVNKNKALAKNLSEVLDFYDKQDKKREKYDYWIDGVVLKINDIEKQGKLGYTGKAPRFAIALKFPAEQKTTIIRSIDLQVGRTGVVTPIAILNPVTIAGTVVSRATLHNFDEIERLDVRIGDTVIIEKAGDIIPKVLKVLPELRKVRSKKYAIPKKAEGCGGDGSIGKKDGEVAYKCIFMDSQNLKAKKLSYFVSKKAFDISEIGPKNIEFFLEKEIISEPADIFKLKISDIENFFGFGKKSAQNIIKAIKNKRKITLERFLISLGIDEVGEETSNILAEEFLELDKIIHVKKQDLKNIDGMGEVMAQKIVDFFRNKKNIKEINNLLKFVTIDKFQRKKIVANYFTDKKILITGTFQNFSRDKLKEIIKNKGGKNVSSISKNTDILLAGQKAGSKLEKAKDLGVEIMDEKKIVKILNK